MAVAGLQNTASNFGKKHTVSSDNIECNPSCWLHALDNTSPSRQMVWKPCSERMTWSGYDAVSEDCGPHLWYQEWHNVMELKHGRAAEIVKKQLLKYYRIAAR